MSRIQTSTSARPWRRVWSVMFVVFVTILFIAPRCTAQALQKGIRVQLAMTTHAVAMPDADEAGALIVAITRHGTVYLGIDPVTPLDLARKLDLSGRAGEQVYVKAHSCTPYANVTKALDAVRKAGITAPILLTAQQEAPAPGKRVLPKGLEVKLGPPSPADAEAVVVQILNSGRLPPRVKIDDQDIQWANLESRLRQIDPIPSEKAVLLHADGSLSFGDIVHVIDACRAIGAKVFLVTPAM
jgi:biopolymer transport protein TolR